MKIGSDNADTDVNVHDSNDHVKSFHDQADGGGVEEVDGGAHIKRSAAWASAD